MKFPTIKEMAQNVAEKAFDEYEYKGKTLRQWVEIIYNSEHGTNLAEVGTDVHDINVGELISRQAAIGIVEFECGEWRGLASTIVKAIEQLPSAQPTFDARDTQYNLPIGTDCISRQAAIDELIKMLGYCFQADEEVLDAVVTTINELPPADPKRETATVSVGKSKGGVTMWYECAACGEPVDQGDTFCSGCGRRLIHE